MASDVPSSGKLSEHTVRKAVKALLKWRKLHPKTPQNPPRFHQEEDEEEDFKEEEEDDEFLYLLLTLHKIPPKDLSKTPHKIPLPHPLLLHSFQESLNLCLIIDDRPIKSPYRITSEAAQKRIESEGILNITKVLKLSKLKEYNSFEKRRSLYDSFDLFLADRRVFPLLPKYLGKQFYKKKRKVPLPLDLMRPQSGSNWKEQIEKAINSALLCFGSGTCSVLKVGNNNVMGCDEIVENVFAAVKGIQEVVPKKWKGIRALHLKLSDSLALPIFEAVPDSRLMIEDNGVEKREEVGNKRSTNKNEESRRKAGI